VRGPGRRPGYQRVLTILTPGKTSGDNRFRFSQCWCFAGWGRGSSPIDRMDGGGGHVPLTEWTRGAVTELTPGSATVVTPTVSSVLPASLEQLREEVLDEELFSETVDVDDVAAQFLTAFLSTVERRRLVDDRVPRSLLAAAGELGPSRRICGIIEYIYFH